MTSRGVVDCGDEVMMMENAAVQVAPRKFKKIRELNRRRNYFLRNYAIFCGFISQKRYGIVARVAKQI